MLADAVSVTQPASSCIANACSVSCRLKHVLSQYCISITCLKQKSMLVSAQISSNCAGSSDLHKLLFKQECSHLIVEQQFEQQFACAAVSDCATVSACAGRT